MTNTERDEQWATRSTEELIALAEKGEAFAAQARSYVAAFCDDVDEDTRGRVFIAFIMGGLEVTGLMSTVNEAQRLDLLPGIIEEVEARADQIIGLMENMAKAAREAAESGAPVTPT